MADIPTNIDIQKWVTELNRDLAQFKSEIASRRTLLNDFLEDVKDEGKRALLGDNQVLIPGQIVLKDLYTQLEALEKIQADLHRAVVSFQSLKQSIMADLDFLRQQELEIGKQKQQIEEDHNNLKSEWKTVREKITNDRADLRRELDASPQEAIAQFRALYDEGARSSHGSPAEQANVQRITDEFLAMSKLLHELARAFKSEVNASKASSSEGTQKKPENRVGFLRRVLDDLLRLPKFLFAPVRGVITRLPFIGRSKKQAGTKAVETVPGGSGQASMDSSDAELAPLHDHTPDETTPVKTPQEIWKACNKRMKTAQEAINSLEPPVQPLWTASFEVWHARLRQADWLMKLMSQFSQAFQDNTDYTASYLSGWMNMFWIVGITVDSFVLQSYEDSWSGCLEQISRLADKIEHFNTDGMFHTETQPDSGRTIYRRLMLPGYALAESIERRPAPRLPSLRMIMVGTAVLIAIGLALLGLLWNYNREQDIQDLEEQGGANATAVMDLEKQNRTNAATIAHVPTEIAQVAAQMAQGIPSLNNLRNDVATLEGEVAALSQLSADTGQPAAAVTPTAPPTWTPTPTPIPPGIGIVNVDTAPLLAGPRWDAPVVGMALRGDQLVFGGYYLTNGGDLFYQIVSSSADTFPQTQRWIAESLVSVSGDPSQTLPQVPSTIAPPSAPAPLPTATPTVLPDYAQTVQPTIAYLQQQINDLEAQAAGGDGLSVVPSPEAGTATPTPPASFTPTPVFRLKTEVANVNVRESPTQDAIRIVTSVLVGTEFEIIGRRMVVGTLWYKVRLQNGEGWISSAANITILNSQGSPATQTELSQIPDA